MNDLSHVLAIPENRAAVLDICRRVLAERDPDSAEIAAGFIEPLIEMAAQGEVVIGDDSDIEGGFGGTDPMMDFIVPTVVGALGTLLATRAENNIALLKNKLKQERKTTTISIDEIEAILNSLFPPGRKKKIKIKEKEIKKLAQLIHAAILANLEN